MEKRIPQHGDPDYDMFIKAQKWDALFKCIPTWQEMLEFEYVRQRGEINMLSGEIQRYAFDRGLYSMVTWLERCKEHRVPFIRTYDLGVSTHSQAHGPRETWITPDVKAKYMSLELSSKEDELRRQLDEIQHQKSLLKNE